jgi:enamine deaminase RidA (YjgF/YER057c/UK114 family)
VSSDGDDPSKVHESRGHESRLALLGIELPGPYPPHDPLIAVAAHGDRARTSGQLPRNHAGEIVHAGLVASELTIDEASEAARWCALNALSVLRAELGTLDRIDRVLTVIGFVKCEPTFNGQPAVVDGASRLLHAVFGEAGRHSRSAIGVASLPRGGVVEIEVEVSVRPTP